MFGLRIISCILNRYAKLYIFVIEEFIFCSYRIEQAMTIPFQSTELTNEIKIYERIIYAVDIHRKGIELIFNQNMPIIIFNCNNI